MITNENGKLAKKALTKIKIKLILLQKLTEDYELFNVICKMATDGTTTVDYINTCIDGINYQFDPTTGKMVELSNTFKSNIIAAHNTAKRVAEEHAIGIDYQFDPTTGKMVELSNTFKSNIIAAHNTAKRAAEEAGLSVDPINDANIATIHKTIGDSSISVDEIEEMSVSSIHNTIDKSTEVVSTTDAEIETMYTTQINEIKSSITTLLSEIEGYISDHC